MELIKEWLLLLLKSSMSHFYTTKSFKKHANSCGEAQPGYIFFQTLHLSSSCDGSTTVDVIYAGREEQGLSPESGLELFVLLSFHTNFLGTDDYILFWRLFIFCLCAFFICIMLQNCTIIKKILGYLFCSNHDRMEILLIKD